MNQSYEWDPTKKQVTIYKNGEYAVGPPDQEVIIVVSVGETNGDNKPSGLEFDNELGGAPPDSLP